MVVLLTERAPDIGQRAFVFQTILHFFEGWPRHADAASVFVLVCPIHWSWPPPSFYAPGRGWESYCGVRSAWSPCSESLFEFLGSRAGLKEFPKKAVELFRFGVQPLGFPLLLVKLPLILLFPHENQSQMEPFKFGYESLWEFIVWIWYFRH